MSTASLVPETRGLSGEDAWTTLCRTGRRRLLVDAFMRMRVSDGFSHARSLAFMTSLVAVQGVIAMVGLAGIVGGSGFSDMVVLVLHRAVPGPAGNALTAAVAHAHEVGAEHRYTAVAVGLFGPLVTGTTALGQLERGLNRLYGVEQDRPSVQKYGRAFLLAATAGTMTALAFVFLAFGRNLGQHVGSGAWSTFWNVARWPLGVALITAAVTVLFRWCPRRCMPSPSWLAFGSAVAVLIWLTVTAGLTLFFRLSRSFGQTYGPLAGVVALMLWALLSGMALLYGAAVAAQLEGVRSLAAEPQDPVKVAESEPDARDGLVAAGRA